MAELKAVTDATFEEEVLNHGRPVVIDFWAAWCAPCKMVRPELEKLAERYEGAVDVVTVDIDANPGLAQAFNIMTIPMIAFIRPGGAASATIGFRTVEQLEQQFGLREYAAKPA